MYVGGYFDTAGGVGATNLAVYNDSIWEYPLFSAVNNEVAALCEFKGKITLAGAFTSPYPYCCFWDETYISANTWHPDGRLYDMCVYDSLLIVAGDFSNVGDSTAYNIASYEEFGAGGQWRPLGSGFDGPVYAVTVYDGKLYAGGHFKNAGGAVVDNIAVWHDSVGAWGPCLTGVSNDADTAACAVYALAAYNNRLYVGGLFSEANGSTVNNIASYALSGWQACGSGVNSGNRKDIRALTVFDGKLIAGGYFTSIGGVSNTNHIAAWNGSAWSALGEGVDGNYWPHVWGLGVHNNSLYAGGRFTVAGTDSTCSNIACWKFTED